MKASSQISSKHSKQVSYSLSIAKPCTENWENMSKMEQGRFCENCQKQVLDFSSLSDAQVIETISKSRGTICGRLSASQMNKTFASVQETPRNVPFYNKIAAGFLMLGFFENQALAASMNNELKQVATPVVSKAAVHPEESKQISGKDTLKNVIEGVVKDLKTGEAISFAVAGVRNSKCVAVTDVNGHFKLFLPDSLLSDSVFFEISFIGYRALEYRFSQNDLPFKGEFNMEVSTELLMTVGALVVTRKVTFWEKLRHPFTWRKRF